jgi:hypothetical protein
MLDLVPADSRVEQLTPSDDTMRPRRNPLDDPVHRPTFCCHWQQRVGRWPVSPPGGRGYGREMEDNGPGDGRSIENPQDEQRIQDEEPVKGETADDAGTEDERVSEPGEGLVTEEGVNEPGTKP